MKVNLQIEINDNDRNLLAKWIDKNESTKRMAKREEVRNLVLSGYKGFLAHVVSEDFEPGGLPLDETGSSVGAPEKVVGTISKELQERLENLKPGINRDGYIIGWNKIQKTSKKL